MAGKKTASKKPKKIDDADLQKAPANVPTQVDDVVFVNREKLSRSQEILAFVSGKRIPKNEAQQEQKERFAALLAEGDVSPKDAGALQFIYELLGGLVRTPVEQEEADEEAKVIRKKNKRRAIQGDDEK